MKRLTHIGIQIGLGLYILTGPGFAQDGSRQEAEPIVPERWRQIYDEWGFAPALRHGDDIFVSGMIVRPSGEGSDAARYRAGLRRTFEMLEELLAVEGATLDDILEMTSFHTDLEGQLPIILDERKRLMREPHPAWTAVGTTELAVPDGLTEIRFLVRIRDAN